LDEEHILVDGAVISAGIFDFALYFYHNAHELIRRGSGPYFYLPKMESHKEARLWNDIFLFSQAYIGIPRGTIRATVLIETLLGAFEMDEIIYELREHSSGLNCGRWDYIFGFIKVFRNNKDFILPDRAQVSMTVPFMANYVRNLVNVCHRRGVHAMGGMAAQIPIKEDEKANKVAMDKVTADKLREVKAGHDGTWVAHPGLIELAAKIFNEHMKTPHQINVKGDTRPVTDKDMLELPTGTSITLAGIRGNINVGLRYVEAWLRGIGCVPIDHLMEDAATAEISRVQLWSLIKHGASADGKTVTLSLVNGILDEELKHIESGLGKEAYKKRKFEQAAALWRELLAAKELPAFLTHGAYKQVIKSTILPLPSRL
jgi:malate synthase